MDATTTSAPARPGTLTHVPSQRGGTAADLASGTGGPARSGSGATRWFRDRGVRAKILLLLGLTAAVVAGTGAYSALTMRDLAARTAEVQTVSDDVATPLGQVHQEEIKARMLIAQAGASVTDDAASQQEFTDKIAATDADLQTAADAFVAGLGGAEISSWDDFTTAWSDWTTIRDEQLLPAAFDSDQTLFGSIGDEVAQPVVDQMVAALEDVESQVAAYLEQVSDTAQSSATRASWLLIAVLAIGLLLIAAVGLVIARTIRSQVVEVQRAVQAMADGDLTVAPRVDSHDELGRMSADLTRAQQHLRGAIVGVVQTAQTVASAAEELSAASAQVVAGSDETSAQAGVVAAAAEQVSRNVQTVAAGAEQMGASIREIAQNSSQAAK
ncbi:MAG TPA: methyl-accepting chemotaxis protein, partial [Cellulomonas sp.]